jgi:hypothetical protein
MKHTLSWLKDVRTDERTKLDYRPVTHETLDANEIETLPPMKRVY